MERLDDIASESIDTSHIRDHFGDESFCGSAA